MMFMPWLRKQCISCVISCVVMVGEEKKKRSVFRGGGGVAPFEKPSVLHSPPLEVLVNDECVL